MSFGDGLSLTTFSHTPPDFLVGLDSDVIEGVDLISPSIFLEPKAYLLKGKYT